MPATYISPANDSAKLFDDGLRAVREAIAEAYQRGRRDAEVTANLRITDARADERQKVRAEIAANSISELTDARREGQREVINVVSDLYYDAPSESADEYLYDRLWSHLRERFN